MIGKRMSYIRAVASIPVGRAAASIAVGSIAGAGAAVPGSIAGLFIAWACLPGPFSNEIIMVLPFLGGLGGALFGLPCGTIGWYSCSAAGQRGWVLSVTLAVIVAASGAVSALTSRAIGLPSQSKSTTPSR